MNVRDIMTKEVTIVTAAQPISDVAHLMRQLDIGSLPVVRDGQLVGIITDRDITIRVVADGLDPHMETAERHMSRDPIVASPDWTVEQAAHSLSERLGTAPWLTTIGVGEHKGEPCIYVYVKVLDPTAVAFLRNGWQGFPVLIQKMRSPRPVPRTRSVR